MSTNNLFRDLHFERLERLNGKKLEPSTEVQDFVPCPKTEQSIQTEQSVQSEAEFSCAVCYTDGETSGLVNPKCCSHKICLSCYTNIVIIHKQGAKCPECRTLYVPSSEAIKSDDNIGDYDDMPPLISSMDIMPMANYTASYINNLINNRINNLNENNINLINDFLILIDEHHAQIAPQ